MLNTPLTILALLMIIAEFLVLLILMQRYRKVLRDFKESKQATKIDTLESTFNGDLYVWADYYFKNRLNEFVPLMDAYDDFKWYCIASNITTVPMRYFTASVRFWAYKNGHYLNPKQMQDGKGRILRIVGGEVIAMLYIMKGGESC